ncbi:Ig-like domain-containing protein [Dokdonella koreensis]|uniref:Ig-like domain-containing protein n=1 Tax=Dokdonella koreensis TaxID=323415 RepID=UPI001680F4A1|nr:invasin domain 3-containing protein [Dokdonella koreensis]
MDMLRTTLDTPHGNGRDSRLPARLRPWLVALAAFGLAWAALVQAAPIAIPNGDFSNAANNGSVGGGVLGGTGTNVQIGAGPWRANYWGVAGLLAPPVLEIGNGRAAIGGLAGLSVLGILNNGGYFRQTLPVAWEPNRRYTLKADINAGSVLGLALINSQGVGSALVSGTTRLSSTTSASLVTLNLLGGNLYELALTYETGPTVSGNIGIDLFYEPSGVLSASLLGAVDFSNVRLETRLLNQTPTGLVAVDADPRSAIVDTEVDPPLSIQVVDQLGDGIQGVTVTFTAPTTGPSATVTPNPATTNANGVAEVTTTANTIAGTYTITGEVQGVTPLLEFQLENLPGPAASVNGISGAAQSAVVGSQFGQPLVVKVADEFGNAVPNVQVAFAAPATGASATFPSSTVLTGANGQAGVTPTANGTAGAYSITANVSGVGQAASFPLVNLLQSDIGPGDQGEPSQNGEPDTVFACALMVRIVNGQGVPQEGLAVDFTAPASGPSALLYDGANSGLSLRVDTDADGYAFVEAVSNGIPGRFQVSAQLAFSLTSPVLFNFNNLAAGDPVLSYGFDGPCIRALGPQAAEPEEENAAD